MDNLRHGFLYPYETVPAGDVSSDIVGKEDHHPGNVVFAMLMKASCLMTIPTAAALHRDLSRQHPLVCDIEACRNDVISKSRSVENDGGA